MTAPRFMRSNYSDLYSSDMLPVLEELFHTRFARHPSLREKLFKVVNTQRDIYQTSESHDIDLFNEMSEGEDYTYKAPKQGANKTLVIKKYGLGFSISEEAVDDGKFDHIRSMMEKLADSGRETQEISAMNIFNNGFSSVTTADGVAAFSSSHTLPSGGTFRNTLSTAADLSPTSLRTAITDFAQVFVGDHGIIKNIKPKILLVAESQRQYAKELLGSQLKPDTSDNNINTLADEGIMVVASPHLTDDDAWFLLADPSDDTGLRIIKRKSIETKAGDPAVGFHNDSLIYKSRYREVIGVTHPYGIFGTAGA